MPDKKPIQIETWQFMEACKQTLTMTGLINIYKKSKKQISRWCADPDYSEESQRNPIDRYESLIKKMWKMSEFEICLGMVARQAKLVGCDLQVNNSVPDKATIEEELLDNLPIYAKYQKAMQDREPIEVIEALKRCLIDEINQDVVLYKEKFN